jgi:hypothetical protein
MLLRPHQVGGAAAGGATELAPPAGAEQQHALRLDFLSATCASLLDALAELSAAQQRGQAAFSDAAAGLQRGADAVRVVADALEAAWPQCLGQPGAGPSLEHIQDVSAEAQAWGEGLGWHRLQGQERSSRQQGLRMQRARRWRGLPLGGSARG